MGYKTFYGEAAARIVNPEAAQLAVDRLEKAVNAVNQSLADKMLALAAKSENEAFGV